MKFSLPVLVALAAKIVSAANINYVDSPDSSLEEETFTHTVTKYVYPPCFTNQVSDIMSGNPSGVSTGIKIHFVYATDVSLVTSTVVAPTPTPNTITLTEKSTIYYNVGCTTTSTTSSVTCPLKKCYTTYYTTAFPTTYLTYAEITSIKLTTGDSVQPAETKKSSRAITAATSEYKTTKKVAGPTITSADAEVTSFLDLTTVPTVTSTLYTASTTILPRSTFTSDFSLDTTHQNPVTTATAVPVTSKISVSLNITAATTKPTTIASSSLESSEFISIDPAVTSLLQGAVNSTISTVSGSSSIQTSEVSVSEVSSESSVSNVSSASSASNSFSASTLSIVFSSASDVSSSLASLGTIESTLEQSSSSSEISATLVSESLLSSTESGSYSSSAYWSSGYYNSSIPASSQSSVESLSSDISSSALSSSELSSSAVASSEVSSSEVSSASESISSLASSSAISSEASFSASSSAVSSESSSVETSVSESSSSASASLSSSEVSSSSAQTSLDAAFTVFPENYNNGYSGDLFAAVDTSAPDSVFSSGEVPVTIPNCVDNGNTPYETNKFYVNLFLSDQDQMVWTYPYGVWWKQSDYFGLAVQHSNFSNRVFGSTNTNNVGVPSYFFNPILNAELVFSATTLSSSANHMGLSNMLDMSATVKISPESSCNPSDYIEAPLVQGMGFVTAVYHGSLIPEINSVYGFTSVVLVSSAITTSNTLKYRVTLSNGVEWLLYVTDPSGSLTAAKRADFGFDVQYTTLTASSSIDGLIIQAAVAPETTAQEAYYDMSAGLYTTSIELTGNANGGSSATYSFEYQTSGSAAHDAPMVFLLPHHLQSLLSSGTLTGITLDSTTKGVMTGILTNTVTMAESLSTSLQFLPWIPGSGNLVFTKEQMELLVETATNEINVDIQATVNSYDSNYFSGKVIDKYAYILYVINEIIKDDDASATVLAGMKEAFSTFTSNSQFYPLMHDTRFGGVTSTAGSSADFGSGFYNDHHFHYGYFIHAAAIVGHVDAKLGGTWAEDNKDWVNSLVRDVANPSHSDSHFPVSRMFDWFHGHSWAGGLFASGDGRNEESSSEDYNFAYGMKLWGRVIGDKSMESRGDLMLAVMSRAMNMYMLFSDDNTVMPSAILPNKVSGIFFDNKVDYTTYFGAPDTHPEYVHGIHMLPITPASALVRLSSFVEEEWDSQVSTFFSSSDDSWKGILKMNQALYDHETSYSFFSSSSWSNNYLDNGLSRTWALAFTGGF